MKLKLTALLAVAALAAAPVALKAQVVPPAPIQLNGGPGIAMAGSFNPNQLPKKALKFLRANYGNQHLVSCENEYAKGVYDLKLSDGTEIAFDRRGNVREIEAADGQALPTKVVRALLPGKTVEHLGVNGFINQVEQIEKNKKGYVVSLAVDSPDDINYSLQGELVSIDY